MGPKYESRQSSGSDSSMAMSREEVLPDEYPAEADESNSDSEVSTSVTGLIQTENLRRMHTV